MFTVRFSISSPRLYLRFEGRDAGFAGNRELPHVTHGRAIQKIYFDLTRRLFDIASNFGDEARSMSSKKEPSIFESIPPIRSDIKNLLEMRATTQGISFEQYRNRLALYIPQPISQEPTVEGVKFDPEAHLRDIQDANIAAWTSFFTACDIATVRAVLDIFDNPQGGYMDPKRIQKLLYPREA